VQDETANAQGPVTDISLTVGLCWRLDIRKDGSAKVYYREGTFECMVQAGPGTIMNFDNLVNRLIELSPPDWQGDRGLVVFFHRQGQSSTPGKVLRDAQTVTRLFRMAITLADHDDDLNRLFQERWPYC
jgi:hypothetical protein